MSRRCAILMIDHGSKRAEANDALTAVADMVKERLGGDWIVRIAHMELAPPSIAEGFAQCVEEGATTVVVHPYMLAKGRHVSEDLPRRVAEAAADHDGVEYIMTDPLGAHPGLADAVVGRCTEALPDD